MDSYVFFQYIDPGYVIADSVRPGKVTTVKPVYHPNQLICRQAQRETPSGLNVPRRQTEIRGGGSTQDRGCRSSWESQCRDVISQDSVSRWPVLPCSDHYTLEPGQASVTRQLSDQRAVADSTHHWSPLGWGNPGNGHSLVSPQAEKITGPLEVNTDTGRATKDNWATVMP